MGPLRIGLTGGIGSGKSTVAALLVRRGAALVDTDALSRSLTAPGGAAIEPIRARFGAAAIAADGALDRATMRRLAFSDASSLAALEAILHPLIGALAEQQAAAAAGATIVFDVPLLVETGHWRRRVDRVLLVDCREDTQIRRVIERSAWTDDAVRRVIAKQATRSHRRAASDAWIYNDGIDLAALEREVDAIARLWGLVSADAEAAPRRR